MIARALAVALTVLLLTPAPAHASDTPGIPWTGGNPYGWTMGDSIIEQGGQDAGLGWRSLGFIGWPGADTTMMRGRIEGTIPESSWPAWTVTEDSVEMERVWFRDAGFWQIGLGTNDVKTMSADQFRANVDWFLEQSRGRPVLWFNIVNPPFQAQADKFNAVLNDATDRYPNLKVLDWATWVRQNPGALMSDGVHIATPYGYDEGRYRLTRAAAPELAADTPPRGYWYWNPAGDGSFGLNGWGSTNAPDPRGPLEINVRADWQHVGRWPVDRATGDLWARTASGHGFGIGMGPGDRGHLYCLDLVDAAGFTSLGCRTV